MSRPLLAAALATVLAAPAWAAPPRVVADIAPVHSLVSRVMEGVGEPTLLIPPGASPHHYALKPSDARALRQAQIVVKIGPQLSPWMDRPLTSLLPESARRFRLLESPGTLVLATRAGATFEPHHDHDHGHEDGHDHADDPDHAHDHDHEDGPERLVRASAVPADVDPHAWLDPENGKVWLVNIAEALSQLDPGNAALYHANAKAGVAEIDAATRDARAAVAPLGDLRFIVFHDAYQYFEHRFGLAAAGAIALSDAAPPGPSRLAELRARVSELSITCALTEPQFDADLVATVFRGHDITTAVIDPIGSSIPPGPQMYPELIRSVGMALADCG